MSKPEWGVKRTCTSCATRFYDLCRDPIVCPKCETVIDPLAMLRSQRSKAPPPAPVKKPVIVKAESEDIDLDDDELLDDDMDDDIEIEEDSETEDAVLEDASELGEDKDDMFEVIDGSGEEGGEEEAR